MNLPFPSCSFFNRAVCVLRPYVPPVFIWADPDIWPLFPRSFASFHPLLSNLNPILAWESCLVTFLSVQTAVILVGRGQRHCDAPVWLIPDWYEKASSLWFYFHSTSLQISVSAISCWNNPYLSEHCKKCLPTPLKMAEKGWVPASCPGFALDTPQPQSILGISSFHFRTGRPPCRDRKPFFRV